MPHTDGLSGPDRSMRLSARDRAVLGERIEVLYHEIRRLEPAVGRMACALYDRESGALETLVDSARSAAALAPPQRRMALTPSLMQMARTGQDRVIDDLGSHPDLQADHDGWLVAQGYRSSYTLPLIANRQLEGFLFFDSTRPALFRPAVTTQLGVYGRLVALMISHETSAVRSLAASVRIARELALLRDVETGAHLDRVSHYCRIIARALGARHGLNDEFCEQVFLFSPLHDIGKIGIADALLRKQARLTPGEIAEMRTHVAKGIEIVDRMARDIGHHDLSGLRVLRNLVAGHHEYLDGSGYPHGWRAGQIPLEARIATVADIFDALSSLRTYKPRWSIDKSVARLEEMVALGKVDGDCVRALSTSLDQVRDVMQRFAET